MTEVVVFPDVEWLLCTYLAAELDDRGYPGIEVATTIPNPRPTRFVRVMRVGGTARSLAVDAPRLAVEFWAEAEGAAHDGLQLCLGLLYAIDELDGHQFYMDPRNRPSPVNLPDPESTHIRYTANVEAPVRGYAV